MRRHLLAVLATLLALVATGCGTEEPFGTRTEADTVPLGAWQLRSATPALELPPDARVTLTVEEADGALRISGTAACNSYSGRLRLDGTSWAIEDLSQTERGCEPALMEAESTYLANLALIDRFHHISGDGDLVLQGPGNSVGTGFVFEREP